MTKAPTSQEQVAYVYEDMSEPEYSRFNIYKMPIQRGMVFATAYTEAEAKMICEALTSRPASQEQDAVKETPNA